MSEYVMVIDEEYVIRFLNEPAARFYGQAPGKKCYKIVRNSEKPCHTLGIRCEVREILEEGKNYFEDTRLSEASGRITHIRAHPTTTVAGKKCILVVARDVTDYRCVQLELENSISMLRATLESTADGILVVDLHKKIKIYNQKFMQILDVPAAILESNDDRRLLRFIEQKLENPKDFRRITRTLFCTPDMESLDLLTLKDGRIIERYSRPQLIAGAVVGRVISIRDVTDRRMSERLLQESEQRYRSLVENAKAAVATIDLKGRLVSANNALAELLGYSKEELQNSSFDSFLHPDDRAKVLRLFVNIIILHRDPGELAFRAVRKDGTVRHLWTRPTRYAVGGKTVGFQAIMMDITEHKKLEEKLQHYSSHLEEMVEDRTAKLQNSEKRFRELAELLPQIVFEIDLKGHFLFLNSVAFSSTGYTRRDIEKGLSVYQLLVPEDCARAEKNIQRALTGQRSSGVEYTLQRKDGSTFPIIVYGTSVVQDGKTVGIRGIAVDITQLKDVERMREHFVSTLTHELQTPLTLISNYVTNALSAASDGKDTQNVRLNLEVAKRNCNRLLELTHDLLDVQRLRSGKLQLNLEPVDLAEIIEECGQDIRPLIYKKKQHFSIELRKRPSTIIGDRVKLSQAIINLLSNASKFTPEGGCIGISSEDAQDVTRVKVTDTGIGIRKDDLGRVFEPFATIEKPSYVKGTGLGLSVTKGIVEAHGGRIWADSCEGKGATFTFILPRRKSD